MEEWVGLYNCLLVILYSISRSAILSSSLGNGVTVGKNDSVLIVFLTVQECTLIVGPRTKIQIVSCGKHATLITPSRVHTNEGTAVNLEQIVGKVQRELCIVLNSSPDSIFIG